MEKGLRFRRLIDVLGSVFESMPDSRGKNKQYSLSEIGLAAFSVFFMQSASFLEWQREVEKRKGQSNVETLFGLKRIASDEQIKNVLDQHSPEYLGAMFGYVLRELSASGVVKEQFENNGRVLVALDGTRYHSSRKVNCAHCSKVEKDGKLHYAHTVVLPAIVKPGGAEVLVLEPEFVLNEDGKSKQDSESAAAKRWLKNKLPKYELGRVVVLGDDLYCRQPTCEIVQDSGHDFVFVCKPNSHKTLYEYLELSPIEEVLLQVGQGKKQRTITYRFANHLPLRDGCDALEVNWCEVTEQDADGETRYHNSFATNLHLSAQSVVRIVAWGRGRWKIENEGNNVLKTKGYNFEHNFGHGKQYLSTMLLSLLLLAFLFHTLFDLLDAHYQAIRTRLGPRRTFFGDLRTLTRFHLFTSWSHLLHFMAEGLELELVAELDSS
jgi:hypothetical protein